MGLSAFPAEHGTNNKHSSVGVEIVRVKIVDSNGDGGV